MNSYPRSHAPAWERYLDAPASCCYHWIGILRLPQTEYSRLAYLEHRNQWQFSFRLDAPTAFPPYTVTSITD